MVPPPDATIAGWAAREQRNVPSRCTDSIRLQAASVTDSAGPRVDDARVVDERIQPPEAGHDRGDHRVHRRRVGHVGGHAEGLRAARREHRRLRVRGRTVEVRDHDAEARRRERIAGRATDATRPTGHERHGCTPRPPRSSGHAPVPRHAAHRALVGVEQAHGDPRLVDLPRAGPVRGCRARWPPPARRPGWPCSARWPRCASDRATGGRARRSPTRTRPRGRSRRPRPWPRPARARCRGSPPTSPPPNPDRKASRSVGPAPTRSRATGPTPSRPGTWGQAPRPPAARSPNGATYARVDVHPITPSGRSMRAPSVARERRVVAPQERHRDVRVGTRGLLDAQDGPVGSRRIRRSRTSGSRVGVRSVTASSACSTTSQRAVETSPWNGSGTPITVQGAPALGNSSCQPPRYSDSQSLTGSP